MEGWENTKYHKWYLSHRRFSFTSKYCIDLYDTTKNIPDSIFVPFLRRLKCHSVGEETFFRAIVLNIPDTLFDEHSKIDVSKKYTNEEKYALCKELLIHMKEEEVVLAQFI